MIMEKPLPETYKPGAVFQITEAHGRQGWIGAFVMATEVKSCGIQGFVQIIETHEKHGCAYIRLPWDQIDYIGTALLVPAPSHEEPEPSTKEQT